MSKVSPGKKQHKSMRGKLVDMDLLRKRNELTPAVGNARVNARGDELGPGGTILRKREEVVNEHYAHAGKARSDSGRAKPVKEETDAISPAPQSKLTQAKKTTAKKTPTKAEEKLTSTSKDLLDQDDGKWVEDLDGNFTKKGE